VFAARVPNVTVLKTSDIDARERGGGLFKGRVTVQPVLDSDRSDLRTNLISFDEGAVNVFHTHDFDQVLLIPAGERHCHGAAPDSGFSHIAISIRDKTTL